MNQNNPMSTPEPWSLVAEGYAAETLPAFEQYCRAALAASNFVEAQRVLDVACGPGTMAFLLQDRAREVHGIDFSPGMIEWFNREIARRDLRNILTYVMDGQNLKFPDNSFDWAFSIFGLMFFPDPSRGFREVARTLKPGGRFVVTSWAPISESTAMQAMFGAMEAAFPRSPGGDSKKGIALDDPVSLRREMERAGFESVSIRPYDGEWPVTDVESFFDSMVRGSAPMTLLRSGLEPEQWEKKRSIMLEHLRVSLPELPTVLHSRAWIGVGDKPS